jgi:hypothetical protein
MRARPTYPVFLLVGLVAGLLTAGLALGKDGEPRFRYERPVLPGAAGPNRLEPDVLLLAGATPMDLERDGGGGLADLRLFDAAGREVPYLLIQPARREPEWRAGSLLPIPPTKTPTLAESGFEVDLGASAVVDRLRVSGLPAPFLKRFRLEGGGDRAHWTLLVAEGTLFDLPDERLRQTEIDFPRGDFRYLRVTWDDTSSARPPLPPRSADVEARLARPVDPRPSPRIPVTVERRPSEPGKSRFHLRLLEARLPGARLPVVALELAVPGGPLLRSAIVTEGRLDPRRTSGTTTQITPVRLGEATLRRAVHGGLTAADLRIPLTAPEGLEGPEGPDLELTVDDGNNPPLDLTGVTAVLAPLPWIYFEAADTRPLTARFGDPKATAPRYDLEAAREEIARRSAPPAPARWGEVHDREPRETPAEASPVPALGAPLDLGKFRYRRPVPAGPPGLTSLLVDAAVLSRSGENLVDLRLADAAGHQIPYLLEKRDEPLSLALPALARQPGKEPRARSEGDPPTLSRYAVLLPYPSLPGARLVLTTKARVFERDVRLVEPASAVEAEAVGRRGDPRDRRGEPEDRTVAQAAWRHADPDTPAPALTLDVPPSLGTRFDLLVEEGDNAPLPLEPPRLLLPAVRLRFFYPTPPAEPPILLYGQPALPPPRYDLALLTPRLLGAAAHEIALQPETAGGATPEADPGAMARKIFWGALVAAVIVLLLVLGRLLRGHPAEPAS